MERGGTHSVVHVIFPVVVVVVVCQLFSSPTICLFAMTVDNNSTARANLRARAHIYLIKREEQSGQRKRKERKERRREGVDSFTAWLVRTSYILFHPFELSPSPSVCPIEREREREKEKVKCVRAAAHIPLANMVRKVTGRITDSR